MVWFIHHPRRKHCPTFNVVRLMCKGTFSLAQIRGGIAKSNSISRDCLGFFRQLKVAGRCRSLPPRE